MLHQFIKEFIDLPHYELVDANKEDGSWVLSLSDVPVCHLCPICFGKTNRMTTKTRTLMHSFTPQTGIIWVRVPSERRYCRPCGATYTVCLPGIPERGRATDSFRTFLFEECRGRAIADISRHFDIPYSTLERWFYEEAPKHAQHKQATHVSVYDFAMRKGHTYGVAIADLETGQVLDIAEGRSTESVKRVLTSSAPYAEVVVSDAASAMAKAIEEVCTSAVHVLDRFHIFQFFTDALNRRRKTLVSADKKHGDVRKAIRLLYQDPNELKDEEKHEVEKRLKQDEPLRALYQALQDIRAVFQSTTKKEANQQVDAWFKRWSFHSVSSVQSIAKTLSKRKASLVAAAIL
ncbi:ISL3 family transposase [Paenalkalicoccus suaedae]|uniref:ISL3 family transposase n=1 Tax=Paenalkalicoccus suaedae TaxID=2592382 RepID=A0A859FCC1_9BACI|nr:transposase [Paenalkalicoccus suaedae]QKS70478.1 ISL3 family transposase [Paenalkalicoccus suaedae]